MSSYKENSASPKRLLELLRRFRRRRILVIGDLMLDRFIWGEVERISPEAPVPVVRVTGESFCLGGAANVIHNIRSLGGEVVACGIVGQDATGRRLVRELKRIGSSLDGVFGSRRFLTTQKSRIIASPRHQQIVRLDRETQGTPDHRTTEKLRRFVLRHASRCDAVVLSDYAKGVIHKELLDIVSRVIEDKDILCVVDPKEENFAHYRKASLITPNKEEASAASGIKIADEPSLRKAGERLLEIWDANAVLVTLGHEGMRLFQRRSVNGYFPTAAREVFDVTGAGDTVVAACALALSSGSTYEEAAVLANLAAGIVVGEVGTFAVPQGRLRKAIQDGQAG